MIITCPACETRYYAGETSLGNGARKVRCAKCGHRWMIEPEPGWTEPQAEPETEAPEPEPDAAPEPVLRAQPFVAAPEPEVTAATVAAQTIDRVDVFDTFTSPPRRRGRMLDRVASLALAAIVLTGVIAGGVQYRSELVRAWPALGGLYAAVGIPVNVRGLVIRNTSWEIQTRDGTPMLVVTGQIANTTGQDVAVPRLSLVLRDARSHELYRWAADIAEVKRLRPGQVAPFTTTLKSPPLEAHDIEIRFLNRT